MAAPVPSSPSHNTAHFEAIFAVVENLEDFQQRKVCQRDAFCDVMLLSKL